MEININPKFELEQKVYYIGIGQNEVISLEEFKEFENIHLVRETIKAYYISKDSEDNLKLVYSLEDGENIEENYIYTTDINPLQVVLDHNKKWAQALYAKIDHVEIINKELEEELLKDHLQVGDETTTTAVDTNNDTV